MKFGIAPVNVGWPTAAVLCDFAVQAESLGFESLWTFEHAMIPVDYDSKYPYHRSGKMPTTPDTNMFDPLITLSHIAALTSTIKLGTGVNILPQVPPLLVAKQVATLDALSGGRMLFGVGVGWLREEFDAMGVPFERRGARFRDAIRAIKKVWSGEVVEHQSDFLNWSGFQSYPLPVQKPHVPFIFGGISEAAMRRTADLGDGWFAASNNADHLREILTRFREVCVERGRDPKTVEISSMWLAKREGYDSVATYEEMGVDRLIVPASQLGEGNPFEGMKAMADAVALRAVTALAP